jgi:hypothetical protein
LPASSVGTGWTLRVLEMTGAFRVRRGFLAGGAPFDKRGSGSELGWTGESATEAESFTGVLSSATTGAGVFFFLGALGFLVTLAGECSSKAGWSRGLPVTGSTSRGAPSMDTISDGPGKGVFTTTAAPGLDRFRLVLVDLGLSGKGSCFIETEEVGGRGV